MTFPDAVLRHAPHICVVVFCALQQGAYDTLMDAGITFFDTSDVYGYKSSKLGFSAEQLLGRFAEENVSSYKIKNLKWLRANCAAR